MLSSPLDVQPDCDDRTIVQPDITLIRQNERIARERLWREVWRRGYNGLPAGQYLGALIIKDVKSQSRQGGKAFAVYQRSICQDDFCLTGEIIKGSRLRQPAGGCV